MADNTLRMIGVFGKREMELAAIKIIDYFKENSSKKKFPETIFKTDSEKIGCGMLVKAKFVNRDGTPTYQFWDKVAGHC